VPPRAPTFWLQVVILCAEDVMFYST